MKIILTSIAAAGIVCSGLSVAAHSQQAPAPLEPCLHVQTPVHLAVHAPYSIAGPMFGPIGESLWLQGHWQPIFIYPQPAADVQGMVFSVLYDRQPESWINSLYDLKGRHIQYVYFVPDVMVAIVDVRFKLIDSHRTDVTIEFTRTALNPQANPQVRAASQADESAAEFFQQLIDSYLEHARTTTQP